MPSLSPALQSLYNATCAANDVVLHCFDSTEHGYVTDPDALRILGDLRIVDHAVDPDGGLLLADLIDGGALLGFLREVYLMTAEHAASDWEAVRRFSLATEVLFDTLVGEDMLTNDDCAALRLAVHG